MVKRKRTLSIKENTDSVHQSSEGDQGIDYAKRPKITNHASPPGRVEGRGGGSLEVTAPTVDHNTATLSTTTTTITAVTTTNTTDGTSVPPSLAGGPSVSQPPLPHVPSSSAALPQVRPTPQLRTSARVLNKQRREETSKVDPSTQASGVPKKLDASGADGDYPDEEDGIGKKRRRAWELWSMDDKNIFFESINECGKDFEAIQTYLTTKLRKKGAPRSQVKNKDQVRHFYYRTWHKISKYITFNEGVKKATQELYGLINFGELRKKIGGILDERRALKLQELIRKGSTSVRVKGKSIRVRTPICRALKRLNQIEEHREHTELRVPTSLMVEIVPGSVHAWCRVHGLAHNPRVRLSCPLQRPLATLFTHLQQKWRNASLKLLDTLSARVTFPLQLPTSPEPILRLLPPRGINIKPVSVQSEVVLKSSFVSLSSHEARLRRRGEKVGRPPRRRDSRQKEGHGERQKEAPEDKQSPHQRGGRERKELGGGEEDSEAKGGEGERTETEGEGGERAVEQGEGRERKELGEGENLEKGGGVAGGELEDLGEASQEEPDDLSDGEVDCLNSDDNEGTPGHIFSPDKHTGLIQVKEEPPDTELSPPREDLFDPDLRVKEEGEGDTLRQLLALETAAGAGVADDDGEVVCTGESTRLTAHMADTHRNLSHTSQTNDFDHGAAGSPDPEEEEGRGEGAGPGQDGPGSGQDLEAWVQKVRCGWTLTDVGGVTVGELYLMFGQNKKICLEYEFEDQGSKVKDGASETCRSNNNNDDNIINNNSNNNNANNTTNNIANTSHNINIMNINHSSTSTDVGGSSEVRSGQINGVGRTNDGEGVGKSADVLPNVEETSVVSGGGTGDKGENVALVVTVMPSLDIPGVGMTTSIALGREGSHQGKGKESARSGTEGEEGQGEKCEEKEKKAVVEDLSGMLAQLLSMARSMVAKSSGESSCPCGHVCGRAGNLLRSPAGGRGQGAGGLGRSPSNTRSPRTGRLTSTTQSPGLASPGTSSATRSPLASRPLKERNKPASAKRLITDTMEQHATTVEARVVGEVSTEPVLLPPTPAATTAGPATVTLDQLGPGGVVGLGAVGEPKVVVVGVGVGGGEGPGGEFKVPLGPAPRQVHLQQANFNAQLTKLLPRYNNRPGRRVVRKNVLVQRQLPLLPKTIIQPVTMRVLQPQPSNKKDGGGSVFIPITVAPTAQSLSPSPSPSLSPSPVLSSSYPSPLTSSGAFSVGPHLVPSSTNHVLRRPIVQPLQSPVIYGNSQSIQSQAHPGSGTVVQPLQSPGNHRNSPIIQPLQSPVNHRNSPIIQPLQSPVNHSLIINPVQPPVNQGTSQILQSVQLSNNLTNLTTSTPVQLSVVSSQPAVPSPSITPLQPGANAISVNISGQPLLTVEMPTMLPTQITEAANKPPPVTHEVNSTTWTCSKLSQSTSSQNHPSHTSTSQSNGLLSSVVSQVLSELPDLSTPPGTPQPALGKSPVKSFGDMVSVVASMSSQLPPSLQLFNSSLSSDSLPALDTPLATTSPLSLSCTLSPIMSLSTLSPVMALSPMASLSPSPQTQLTPITTRHLELSPPPSQTNGLSSLLNTPTPQTRGDRSPPTMPPSISSLLSSSSSDLIAKGFPTILGSDDSEDASAVRDGNLVPELHIPEGSVNLPLLDISLGGTVTLAEQVPGLLSTTDPEATLGVSSTTAASTSAVTTMIGVITQQDSSSSDKLLDITLGNSNSNSSFSSLLAAATLSRQLDPSLLDQASLDTGSICAMPGSVSGGEGAGLPAEEGLSGGGLAGFPQLSNTPLSPPSSPSRLLQQTDTQWLNNEVNDFSLSSFLGHLESPIKNTNNNSRGSTSSSQAPVQLLAQPQAVFIPSLSAVYNENSVDFMATFAEMKAQVSGAFKE